VSYESASVRAFLAGGPEVERDYSTGWLANVRRATNEGRRFARVRVISVPFSDYSRYGIWSSKYTTTAGEDIRYLARGAPGTEELPDHDYWLLDSRRLVRMHFDEDDQPLNHELIDDDPALILQHNYWRDAAWHQAIRREEFAAAHDVQRY
jgi:hypothetical protein